jgi:hypothetical protein
MIRIIHFEWMLRVKGERKSQCAALPTTLIVLAYVLHAGGIAYLRVESAGKFTMAAAVMGRCLPYSLYASHSATAPPLNLRGFVDFPAGVWYGVE